MAQVHRIRYQRSATAAAFFLMVPALSAQDATEVAVKGGDPSAYSFADPVRLEADGKPIDIGESSDYAHAGPMVADLDGDGDRDLLVGDFPGYFWVFDNVGTDAAPSYTAKGKLQAGGQDAKTPVY